MWSLMFIFKHFLNHLKKISFSITDIANLDIEERLWYFIGEGGGNILTNMYVIFNGYENPFLQAFLVVVKERNW